MRVLNLYTILLRCTYWYAFLLLNSMLTIFFTLLLYVDSFFRSMLADLRHSLVAGKVLLVVTTQGISER